VDLEVFYLGHVKNLLYNTIQYTMVVCHYTTVSV